jgi:hypothetical protein
MLCESTEGRVDSEFWLRLCQLSLASIKIEVRIRTMADCDTISESLGRKESLSRTASDESSQVHCRETTWYGLVELDCTDLVVRQRFLVLALIELYCCLHQQDEMELRSTVHLPLSQPGPPSHT